MSSVNASKKTEGAIRVLVTGAAGGSQGATGRLLTHLLLKRGVTVRAFVRSSDDRAASLKAAGAEVFVGDMERWEDVNKASMDVDYIYFCYPVQAGLLEATTLCARAARDHGVKGVLNLSQWTSDILSHSPHARRHNMSESIFDAFPVPTTHLQAAMFDENIVRQLGRRAKDTGKFSAPAVNADDHLPLMAAVDVAKAADIILQKFDQYADEAVPMLAELKSMRAMADDFATTLHKKVTFETITTEDWKREALEVLGDPNDNAIGHLAKLWEIMHMTNKDKESVARLIEAIPRLEQILGEKPAMFSEWLPRYLGSTPAEQDAALH